MNLPKITIFYAVLLILLGVLGYILTGFASITALIPAFFGAVLMLLGYLGLKENLRKHVMHAASLLGLIGFASTFTGITEVFTMIGGTELERPAASISKAIMSILSLAYFGLCLNSFVQTRRQRKAS